jgi:hypothetical protein
MPDNLPVRSLGLSLSRRDERALSRDAARLEGRAALEVARTRALEAVESAKVQAIADVANVALTEVAVLSGHEAMYAARDPQAAGRLAYIADEAAVTIGARIHRFGRRLG